MVIIGKFLFLKIFKIDLIVLCFEYLKDFNVMIDVDVDFLEF